MKISSSPIVFFPIDTVSREFEWQLILAFKLKKLGYTSFIGKSDVIRNIHKNSENSIWFGRFGSATGKNKTDYELLKYVKKNKTKFIFLHDEGGLYHKYNFEDRVLLFHPYEAKQTNEIFKILSWGQAQRDILIKNGVDKNKVKITGIPRFDLYKKEFDWIDIDTVNQLKNDYGDFNLILTRFASVNHLNFKSGIISPHYMRKFNFNDKGFNQSFDFWENDCKVFSSFVKMIKEIAYKFSDELFILRPHPSESKKFYEDAFYFFDNVQVVKKGDVRPWIKAAKNIIHSDCTTGVEGILAGKPVLNYKPAFIDEKYYIEVASEAGNKASTIEEAISFFEKNDYNQELGTHCEKILMNINDSSYNSLLNIFKNFGHLYKGGSKVSVSLKKHRLRTFYRKVRNLKKQDTKQGDLPKDRINFFSLKFNESVIFRDSDLVII